MIEILERRRRAWGLRELYRVGWKLEENSQRGKGKRAR
jgi:hypothetical protein